ncbi:MAG TPA: hypothetical protein VNF73_09595 [Candidatus Saccharimonadales bacterium]|nr:hypothetical protein [Candidatus Saccharimonadales bacterium]
MGAFRFCRRCGLDFEQPLAEQAPPVQSVQDGVPAPGWVAPKPAPAAAPAPSFPTAAAAGIAWIAAAVLIGYLALVQLGAAGQLGQLGFGSGDLQTTAIFNGISAAITLFFGARLLTRATRGFLGWSAFWAAISVGWGAYQVANGATHWAFIGSIVASGAAGILSFVAWSQRAGAADGRLSEGPRLGSIAELPPAGAPPTSFSAKYAGRAFGGAPATAAPAPPIATASASSDRGNVAVAIGVLVVIAVVAAILLSSSLRNGNVVAPAAAPPTGSIWFGSSFDPSTLVLTGRSNSIPLGQAVAFVAHLSRASIGESLALDLDIGGMAATWPGGQVAAGDDVVGIVLPAAEIYQAGTLAVTVVDVGGNPLAHGQVTITP